MVTINLILECLFGKGSSDYERIYEKGYIDETFSYDYTEEHGFGFVSVGGDTPEPDKLAEEPQTSAVQSERNDHSRKAGTGQKEKNRQFPEIDEFA